MNPRGMRFSFLVAYFAARCPDREETLVSTTLGENQTARPPKCAFLAGARRLDHATISGITRADNGTAVTAIRWKLYNEPSRIRKRDDLLFIVKTVTICAYTSLGYGVVPRGGRWPIVLRKAMEKTVSWRGGWTGCLMLAMRGHGLEADALAPITFLETLFWNWPA